MDRTTTIVHMRVVLTHLLLVRLRLLPWRRLRLMLLLLVLLLFLWLLVAVVLCFLRVIVVQYVMWFVDRRCRMRNL